MMLLTACSISGIEKATNQKATDSALCSGLKEPIDKAVDTTLQYQKDTPAPVVNDWTSVVKGYDSVC